jgi:hypothetical protein
MGKRPLGRPRHRWEDNIRMNIKEIGINMRNWVDSAQNRDYWIFVSGSINFVVFLQKYQCQICFHVIHFR